jgi:thymidylate synthase
MEQAQTQFAREPCLLPQTWPNLAMTGIFCFRYDDFELVNSESWPAIDMPVAV